MVIDGNKIGHRNDIDLLTINDQLLQVIKFRIIKNNSFKIDNKNILSETSLGNSVITSSLESVGVLNNGSIGSGFGDINTGNSNIETLGKGSFGELQIDNIVLNGSSIGHINDSDLLSLSDQLISVSGNIRLLNSKNYQINTSVVLSETVLGSTVKSSSLESVGSLSSGSIVSGFGSIDVGSNNISTQGKGTFGEIFVSDLTVNDTITFGNNLNMVLNNVTFKNGEKLVMK